MSSFTKKTDGTFSSTEAPRDVQGETGVLWQVLEKSKRGYGRGDDFDDDISESSAKVQRRF